MKTLHISSIPGDPGLPIDFLSLRCITYGGSGAGKTSFGRVIFEEAIKAGIPCGVIDLKADWWGLKSSADGKADGIPVVIFGGEHGDLPLDENGGAELAEIVAELRQPFIIDLEHFSKGKQLKFLAPFFDRLYDKNRHPLKLICDEADRYIPQRLLTFGGQKDNYAAQCLGAGEDIAKRGRKHGIFPLFISQRNADLNKSVTELCDIAVVFRTSGPNDQKAVDDWFNAKGSLVTEEQREQVMHDIARLDNGMAYFCCAHPHLSLFRRIQVRLPETFDSSATPEIGKELVQPRKFAKIELEKLGERMRATVEHAKANDPAELKRQLLAEKKRGNQLESKLAEASATASASKSAPETKIEKIEVPILTEKDRKLIYRALDLYKKAFAAIDSLETKVVQMSNELEGLSGGVIDRLEKFKNLSVPHLPGGGSGLLKSNVQVVKRAEPSSMAIRHPAPTIPHAVPGVTIGRCERLILTALAQYPQGRTTSQVGILTGYTEGGMKNALSQLRTGNLIERGQPIKITEIGLTVLGEWQSLPNGEDLQNYWLNKLGLCERTILQALLDVYPGALTMDELVHVSNYTEGGMKNALSKLRTLELMLRGQPMKASPEFFQ